MGFGLVGVAGGAYDGRDWSIACVANGLPCFLQTSKHCVMCQLPQFCLMLLCSVKVEFEVGEVIDETHIACIV